MSYTSRTCLRFTRGQVSPRCGDVQVWVRCLMKPHTTHTPKHDPVLVVGNLFLQSFHGPPSLTSSFAAAKTQSLLFFDVVIVDQPETERVTSFQIWMRLADSDSTEQIQHGHSVIAVRHHRTSQQCGDFAAEIYSGGGSVAAASR